MNTTFAGVIEDGTSGPGGLSLTVDGLGRKTLTLTGANTFSGGTTITSAASNWAADTSAGSGAITYWPPTPMRPWFWTPASILTT